jgi:pyruvate kinase
MVLTKTGIVATVGPACSSEDILLEMVLSGVTTFRLNFSHGTFDDHLQRLETINRIREKITHEISVMGDLCGPKLRIGKIDPEGQVLKPGNKVVISSDCPVGNAYRFGTNYPGFVQDVFPGQRVMINDGAIVLTADDKTETELHCTVVVGGAVLSNKGINLPDSKLGIPAITEKDWKWVDWAIANKLDYLALSFVQEATEIYDLKEYLSARDSWIRVVAKIEKPRGVNNLEAIIEATDAALVARGDLGVEMDIADVPLVQKRITALCRKMGKPVIVATQVMQSMIENPIPTRAEASDVANAVMDFTDAIMLSGETAVGQYPLESVKAVAHICRHIEAWQDKQDHERPLIETEPGLGELAAIARAAAQMLDHVKVKLAVVWTQGGHIVRLLSKARMDVPIIAICPDVLIARQMSLHYGVFSVRNDRPCNLEDFSGIASKMITENQWAAKDERVLFILPQDILNIRTPLAMVLRIL